MYVYIYIYIYIYIYVYVYISETSVVDEVLSSDDTRLQLFREEAELLQKIEALDDKSRCVCERERERDSVREIVCVRVCVCVCVCGRVAAENRGARRQGQVCA